MESGVETTVKLAAQPFDVAFHPSADVVAAGLISGSIEVFTYGAGGQARAWKQRAHRESCRALRFLDGGNYIASASKDKSILISDAATGQLVTRVSAAHESPINRLSCISEQTFATGDDDGCVKVWDHRQHASCSEFDVHNDFIADLAIDEGAAHLLAASGDGTLSVFNLRRSQVEAQSENAEDELLSLALLKRGRKVVCGTQGGVLLLYSWGLWEDCSDRFPGHPESVDAMLSIDDDTILTGSSDGIIRIVALLPNKMLGVVGEHADYPIERLALSHDGKTLASASHDKTLKLWDVSYLMEDREEEDIGDEEMQEAVQEGGLEPEASGQAGRGGEGASAEDSDEEDGKMEGKGKKKQTKQAKGNPNSDFYRDL